MQICFIKVIAKTRVAPFLLGHGVRDSTVHCYGANGIFSVISTCFKIYMFKIIVTYHNYNYDVSAVGEVVTAFRYEKSFAVYGFSSRPVTNCVH